ncbi:MAG: hypothetical protein JWM80_1540, partial [Cyanobacteria bacterium RYN_339]|nr:hypothetical protein [Cyanobacteria bacterium RYN_339]
RLLAAARARAHAAGLPVIDVRGAGPEAAPLAALAGALRTLGARAGLPVAALLAAPLTTGPEGPRERLRLAAAISDLARQALPGGAVWLIDDHDRLDPVSREVLACLRRNGGDRPWRWFWSTTAADHAEDVLTLAQLPAPTVVALAEAMLAGPLPARLQEPLVDLAGGLPGRAREVLEAWLRAGVLAWDERGWHAGDLARAVLPTDAVEGILAGLSADARAFAGLTAGLGETGPLAGLEALAEAELPGWPAAWAELLARGVLVAADGRYAFATEALHLACRDAVGPGRRQELQARAFALLAPALPDPAPLDALLIVARQAIGGRVAAGAPCIVRAARAALALHEIDLADGLVQAARGWAGPVELDLEVLAAQVARARGAVAAAREAFEGGLLDRLAARGDADLAHHHVTLGVLRQLAGDYAGAAATYAAAIDLGPPEARLRAHVFAGRTAVFRGRSQEAGEHFAAALALADDPALARWRGWALGSYGQWLEARGGEDRARGMALLAAAIEANRAANDVYFLHEALNNLGNAHLAAGELAPAREAFDTCRGIAARFGLLNERAFGLVNAAAVSLEAGALPAALDDARAALASARAQGRRYPEGLAAAFLGLAQVHAGDAAAGLAELDRAAGLAGAIANRYLELTVLALRAEAELALEHVPAATAAWTRATALAQETANQEQRGRLDRVGLALAVLAGGPRALAAAEAAVGAAHSHRGHAAHAWFWAGVARVQAGKASEALEAFARAEQLALAAGQGLLAGEASFRRGLLAPSPEAEAHLARALEDARARGRSPLAARAAAALASRQGDEAARRDAMRRLRELAAPLGGTASPDPGEAQAAAAVARLGAVLHGLALAADPDAVAAQGLAALIAVTGAERGMLVEYNGLAVTCRHHVGARDDEAEAFSRTLAHRVVVEGRTLYVADIQADQDLANAPSVRRLGLRAFVGLPLEANGQVVGALIADSRRLLPTLGPAARAELAALGRQVAHALDATRRQLALAQEGQDARAALTLAREVLGWHPAEAVDYLLAAAMARCGARRAFMLVGPELGVAAARGADGVAPPLEAASWARDGGRALQLPLEDPPGATLVLVPVGARGVLALERGPESRQPVPMGLLREIAGLLAPLACLPLPYGAV